MKKLLICAITLFVLLSISTKCFAGDVPQSLLFGESTHVYLGEMTDDKEDGTKLTGDESIPTKTIDNAEKLKTDTPSSNIFTLFLILSGIILIGIIFIFWKKWKQRNN